MAIPVGGAIEYFDAFSEVTDGSASVANGAFSIAADVDVWVNTENALRAAFVLECEFSVAPGVGSVINLYGRRMDIAGAGNHERVPSANQRGAYIGSFYADAVTAAQNIPLDAELMNIVDGQSFEFYLENLTGQTLPAGWVLSVAAKAVGPKAE